jgi:uncharacterized membrane protein YsdA (DUF1294 family)
MCYYFGFGLISAAMAAAFGLGLYSRTAWNPYAVWVAALSGTTFVMYGLDKLLAQGGGESVRAPEGILHLLALLGGFPGGWLGMAAFRHKISSRRHPAVWVVLGLSTLGHAVLAYYWFGPGR